MIRDLLDSELEEYIELGNRQYDFPQEMHDGDWDRYNELRDKRFEGE